MVITDWQQVAAVVSVISGVAIGARILWRILPKIYYKLVHNMFGVGDIKKDLGVLTASVNLVVTELSPNGGASIRDSLNRIELRQVLQEQRQKAILSDMSVGVFETDDEGEFTWVNRKYLRMTGRAPDEVKGSGWINTVAHRDRGRIALAWKKAINEGREFEEEFMMITPDNDRVQVQARTYKMSDKEHGELGFVGMLAPKCDKGRRI